MAEPVSRDQLLRHARGQGNINFACSADREQDWQPYPVDPYSAICDDHTYIHTYIHTRTVQYKPNTRGEKQKHHNVVVRDILILYMALYTINITITINTKCWYQVLNTPAPTYFIFKIPVPEMVQQPIPVRGKRASPRYSIVTCNKNSIIGSQTRCVIRVLNLTYASQPKIVFQRRE